MKKSILLFVIFFCSLGYFSYSQNKEDENQIADTAKIGIYIFSLYDIDFPGNKLNADFYVWYNYKNDSLKLPSTFELVNCKGYNKSNETIEKRGNINYETFRVNSVLRKDWDVTDFPFDEQTIEIIIEDFDKDNSKLVFIADTIGSKIDKTIKLEGWDIKDFKLKVVDHTYETTYGDPKLALNDYTSYSRVILTFTIERQGKGIFLKLFLGLFISVLIALITFFIDPLDLDPRFGLSVGAIFAAIASQYVITSTLPQNQKLTLVDKLHDLSYIYIFLCLLMGVIALSLKKQNRAVAQKKMDRYAFWFLVISYLCLAYYFVKAAI